MDTELEREAARLFKRAICEPNSNARAVVKLLDEKGCGPLEAVLIGTQLIMLGQIEMAREVRRMAERSKIHDSAEGSP